MKITNLLVGTCLAIATWNSFAIGPEKLINLSNRINNLVNRNIYELSDQQMQNIAQSLRNIRRIIKENVNPNPPYPNPGNIRYSATCHIDDDIDFDFGQNIVGKVEGFSVRELISKCSMHAEFSYQQAHSSGLQDLKFIGNIPFGFQVATCHIDDDPDFDFNQMVLGKIIGRDVIEIINECQALARSVYRSQGSSSINDLNVNLSAPYGYATADCWLDDDPDFDHGQTFVGSMWSTDPRDIKNQCQAIARQTYGSNGSSGLTNLLFN